MVKPARFRKGRYPRTKVSSGAKWVVLLALVLAAWFALREPVAPPERVDEVAMTFRLCGEAGRGPCVIDGDTLAIGQRRVRLTGFDAPEMDGACEAERAKAARARDALLSWLDQGRFHWTGGTEPPYDQYGRELREARRGDDLLADHMIAAGLAEGMGWGAERVEWC
ncbi:thermonuclease family protein [Erythrobacter sp. SD-21]|uniref:thermonuclease family protein n=1 Tax=Erythrobacter sp. SD-21 TaxID=161528 RepID=UPI000153F47E|nr:hypothetical protein [Erythrobacter sp. SD-21]EDL49580.1 nuclease [Erythrobacter sp. SD-21]